MLDKNCKKILKVLNKYYGSSNFLIEENALKSMAKLDHYQFKSSIEYLQKIGLVQKNTKLARNLKFYKSTIEGLLYFKNVRKPFYLTLLSQLICPAIVALITSFLTLLLAS